MLNFLIFSATFVFSISLCRFTFVTSGIESCLNSFDFASAQSTVVVPFETGMAPYFSENGFKEVVNRHFAANLERYLSPFDKYDVTFFFNDDPSYIKDAKTEKNRAYVAGFVFSCEYLGFASYKQEKRFAIEVGKTYEG